MTLVSSTQRWKPCGGLSDRKLFLDKAQKKWKSTYIDNSKAREAIIEEAKERMSKSGACTFPAFVVKEVNAMKHFKFLYVVMVLYSNGACLKNNLCIFKQYSILFGLGEGGWVITNPNVVRIGGNVRQLETPP